MLQLNEATSEPSLNAQELARYSRHIILPGIGREGQERLKQARVLCIGMGGLGSPAALYLAAGGVGTLGLIDFDRVESHNLHRQILHDDDRVGHLKVDSARDRLQAINPHLNVELFPEALSADNIKARFDEFDIIVDGSDNFGTRYMVSDAASLFKKPLVYGSVFQFEGQVSVFSSGPDVPCYRCLFPTPPAPGTIPNCAEAGVFGALCGVIGSYQAMEAIKLITGVGEPLAGRLLVVDALSSRITTLNLKKDPACPTCGDNPEILEINAARYDWACDPEPAMPVMTASDLDPLDPNLGGEIDVSAAASLLKDHPEQVQLIDVREPFEIDICSIEGSRKIPMGSIPEQVRSIPKDKRILLLCHHGGRSLQVTNYLQQRGFSLATNIHGGIHQWAEQIDPTLQKY